LVRTHVLAWLTVSRARGDDLTMRTKKITAMAFGWALGILAGAGIFALLQNPADKEYWPSVASFAAFLLTMLVANWIRDERPPRRHGLWAIALALVIPAIVLAFSFGVGPAVAALGGGLIVALILMWPFLRGKETAAKPGT
jgi:peptidoglycan/LPS O-acetylase OafA/YrhL